MLAFSTGYIGGAGSYLGAALGAGGYGAGDVGPYNTATLGGGCLCSVLTVHVLNTVHRSGSGSIPGRRGGETRR